MTGDPTRARHATAAAGARRHPLLVLLVARMKSTIREPRILFWTSGFPILLAFALGTAFKFKQVESVIGVLPGPNADAVAAAIDAHPSLAAEKMTSEVADDRLRHATIVLAVEPRADGVRYHLDVTRPDAETTRVTVDDALQRAAGRRDVLAAETVSHTAAGARYVDWLIPGILGMQMMMGNLTFFAYGLVHARQARVLKLLSATPMQRAHYLLSVVLARLIFTTLEVPALVLFGKLVFDVGVRGSVANLAAAALLGTLAFSGIGLLAGSRADRAETVSGLVSLFTLPMMIFSGVFFSSARFPPSVQPFVHALPLTALNDVLRAIINDGASLSSVARQLLVLAAWSVGGFGLALRLFRWT